MGKIEYSLEENSMSFFIEALEKSIRSKSEPDQWKFAILALIQAIELSIKECLKREHEMFVFSNIDSPKHTVSMDIAIKRLFSIQNIEISNDDKRFIDIAKAWRNSIVHHHFSFSETEVNVVFSSLLGFYIHFTELHLNTPINKLLSSNLLAEVLKNNDFLNELRSRADERIKKEKIDHRLVTYCPNCNSLTFVANLNGQFVEYGTCYVCNHSEYIGYCEICCGLFACSDMESFERKSTNGESQCYLICKSYCLPKFK